MSYLTMMGLFLLKHGLLAHVVDFGYSYSRGSNRRFWFFGLFTHSTLEVVASFALLVSWGKPYPEWMLAGELSALAASSWVERRAPMRRLLHTHFACEVAVLATYALMLGCIFRA